MAKIRKTKVYGLDDSVEASKYPFALDVGNVNSDITDRTISLANCKTGTGHDNFLNGIIVQFDLTFSNKAWVEAERYHFLDFVSSQSTMHCISKMEIRNMCNEYVTEATIKEVERLKDMYLSTKAKEDYLRLLYNIPSGFELTARMTTNLRQLKTIYYQRRNHKLPDWKMFCDWLEQLEVFKELVLQNERRMETDKGI